MPGSHDLPPRRQPDELMHRHAHQAATKAVGKVMAAYETQLWDAAAVACLSAVCQSSLRNGGKKDTCMDPADAAEIAAEYADAILVERRKRVKGPAGG